ncbi:hypothetical protein BBJ28_00007956 [Nothophytophthora sp. Chile5]|nr:hypothetical protein BBJ28_00007956 [Nothophytophthora sp. Chile5]
MTISTRIRSELFVKAAGRSFDASDSNNTRLKTEVKACINEVAHGSQLIRLPLTRPPNGPNTSKTKKKKKKAKATPVVVSSAIGCERHSSQRHGLAWTVEEHERFLQGLERFPSGPWKAIAAFVGTRTSRQTMTHAQKYRQKIQRRRRGLLTSSRKPIPVTSERYNELTIDTSVSVVSCTPPPPSFDCVSNSPTAVDVSGSASTTATDPLRPLDSTWFDNVAMEDLDAAFHAFLDEVYDPALPPLDGDADLPSRSGYDCDYDYTTLLAETSNEL